MERLIGNEVAEISWCDVNFTEISWANDGCDLILKWNLHNNQKGILKCSWAHSIALNLETNEKEKGFLLRQLAINNPPVLLVFLPVFCVATTVT